MIIRPLADEDLAGLESLVEESEADGFRFLRRFRDGWIAGRVRTDAPGECFLGVVDGDVLVAIGGVTRDPYLADARTGRIRHVYVARSHRRRGVGRRLLAALEDRAREMFDVVRLRTDTEAASRFYESIGYATADSESATHVRELHGAAGAVHALS